MEERRASPRHTLKPALACRVALSTAPDPVPAVALNLSAGGIGLYLARAPGEAGTALLELMDGPTALRHWLPLRVAHRHPTADGGHHLGGAFADPLPEVNLRTLSVEP